MDGLEGHGTSPARADASKAVKEFGMPTALQSGCTPLPGRATAIVFALLLTVVCAGWPLAARAQSTVSSTIHGSVTDETGAALPGATVTLTSPALQVPQMIEVTDQDGNYRFLDFIRFGGIVTIFVGPMTCLAILAFYPN